MAARGGEVWASRGVTGLGFGVVGYCLRVRNFCRVTHKIVPRSRRKAFRKELLSVIIDRQEQFMIPDGIHKFLWVR